LGVVVAQVGDELDTAVVGVGRVWVEVVGGVGAGGVPARDSAGRVARGGEEGEGVPGPPR
jgi:hypothetical protein